jgi:hypothetical protein
MEVRNPTKEDFDGQRTLQIKKDYSTELPSGDVFPPRPVTIVHFMQPMCSTYGMPTRKMLIELMEERPLNTFIEFREAVMRENNKQEAEGKSVIGGWSKGLDRDLKDETFDIHGSAEEMIQTGFEIICPFTKVEMNDNGKVRNVLRMIGSDAINNFELYETLIRLKMDEFSNVENSERLFELTTKHQDTLTSLAQSLTKNGKKTRGL